MAENFIYQPNTSTYTDHQNDNGVNKQFFCLKEDSDFIDDNTFGRHKQQKDNTLAFISTKESKSFYYIKSSNSNQLFNPFSKFDTEKSYSFLDNVVRPTNKFIDVNKTTFDYYLKFIQTKNTLWLNQAERERI